MNTILYELMVITAPELTEAQASKVNDEIKAHLKDITYEDVWGKRKFAYPIKKRSEGYYIVWNFNGSKDDLAELTEFLRLHPSVLRHLLVTVPEDYTPLSHEEMDQGVDAFYEGKKKEKNDKKRPAVPAAKKPAPVKKEEVVPKKEEAPVEEKKEEAPVVAKEEVVPQVEEAPVEEKKEEAPAPEEKKEAEVKKPAKKEEKAEKKDDAPKTELDEKLDKLLFGDDLDF